MPDDNDAVRMLDARLREARGRLDRLEARLRGTGRTVAGWEKVGVEAPDGGSHILFVPSPGGYGLVERGGAPPPPGYTLALGDGDGTYLVTRVASSPLPGDPRPCAYLQPV